MPWLWSGGLNSSYQYGLQDGTNPISFDVVKGQTVSLQYVSGTVSAAPNKFPYVDANGYLSDPVNNDYDPYTDSYYASYYMSPYPIYISELVGVFTDKKGVLVGAPFAIGDGPTNETVPKGATKLQLGVNDDEYSDNAGSWVISITGGCGDGDQLIQEYITYHNKFVPTCKNFTTSASGPVYTFAMLNSSFNYTNGAPYSHILLNIVLVQAANVGPGLDLWLHYIEAEPNYQFHAVTSGYRNPEKQAQIYKKKKYKVVESQHVYGDAVDLQNISMTKAEYDMLKRTAIMADASWVEDFSGPKAPCTNLCVHADWRKYPKAFAP